jgi:hemerythrin-like metal-binding protein
MQALEISVGNDEIDSIHRELAGLVKQLADASDAEFQKLFQQLIIHTEAHFFHEEELMRESGFLHSAEHIGEHRQMLGEMKQFAKRRLPISRSYVRQRLAERFSLHITRMDSLLAAFLRST